MTIYNFSETTGTTAAALGLIACTANDGYGNLSTNGSGQIQNTSGTLWNDTYSPNGNQNSHGKITIPAGETPFGASFSRYISAACRRTASQAGYFAFPRSSTNNQIIDQVSVYRNTIFGGFVGTAALTTTINLATTPAVIEVYVTNTVDLVIIANGESHTISGSGGNDASGNAVLTGGAAGFSIYNNTPPGAGGLIDSFDDGASVAPALSAGSPAGAVVGPNPTLSCTTDTTGVTGRIVVDTAANLSGVSTAQVMAGQKAAGTAALGDSGNITVGGLTVSTTAITGLANGVYNAAFAQTGVSTPLIIAFTVMAGTIGTVTTAAPTGSAAQSGVQPGYRDLLRDTDTGAVAASLSGLTIAVFSAITGAPVWYTTTGTTDAQGYFTIKTGQAGSTGTIGTIGSNVKILILNPAGTFGSRFAGFEALVVDVAGF